MLKNQRINLMKKHTNKKKTSPKDEISQEALNQQMAEIQQELDLAMQEEKEIERKLQVFFGDDKLKIGFLFDNIKNLPSTNNDDNLNQIKKKK